MERAEVKAAKDLITRLRASDEGQRSSAAKDTVSFVKTTGAEALQVCTASAILRACYMSCSRTRRPLILTKRKMVAAAL